MARWNVEADRDTREIDEDVNQHVRRREGETRLRSGAGHRGSRIAFEEPR